MNKPSTKSIAVSIAIVLLSLLSSSSTFAANPDTRSTDKMFIFPTKGEIIQSFNDDHYAIDIYDKSKPPVWAPASGSIIKVSQGTWAGGYGTYIIIDHGDGLQSLYSHLGSVNVVVGQQVIQGDVIGIMGNTGRVYGKSGIHLHWELRKNGLKVNPVDYLTNPESISPKANYNQFIFPTIGNITQGYHVGHYALDVENKYHPQIWAPASGTIEKISLGIWNGGYGNQITINHGNGLKTLYAHLNSINVYEGQWVNQGDIIGIMGNTGRIFGNSETRLHWEVIDNGIKKNPSTFY